MNLRLRLPARARACGAVVLCPLHYQPSSPWLPVAVYGPLAGACVLGNLLAGPPAWAWVVLPASGLLLWTLLEYVLHSRFFHDPPRGFHWMSDSHGSHHDAPDDPERIVGRLSLSLPMAAGLFAILSLVLWDVGRAALVFVGLAVGYLSYEVIHFSIHRVAAVRRLVRPLASHHLHHHYADASRCFGVTTPLWDWVFRTGRREVGSRVALAPIPQPPAGTQAESASAG
jgi:sterol desaturase/sphingolipid hydroxylase (fatty acid hydroxylase superfamily)